MGLFIAYHFVLGFQRTNFNQDSQDNENISSSTVSTPDSPSSAKPNVLCTYVRVYKLVQYPCISSLYVASGTDSKNSGTQGT